MKPYILYLCVIFTCSLGSFVTMAQPTTNEQATIDLIIEQDSYKSSLAGFKSDANYLFDGFGTVAVKSLAYQLNAGWINGKTLGAFPRFSVMFVGSISNTPAKDKTFYVDNDKLTTIQLKSDVDGVGESRVVATIFGDRGLGSPKFEAKPTDLSVHPDQVGVIPSGAGINYLPSGYLRGQVGLFKGTDLVIKLLPAFTAGTSELTLKNGWLYGIGIQHNISQWLYGKRAVSGLLPKISIAAGYTSYDLTARTQQVTFGAEFTDENTFVATSEPTTFEQFKAQLLPQETYMKFTAMHINLMASVNLAFLTPYIAFGYSSVNTYVKVKGDYPIVILDPSNSFLGNKYLVAKTTDPITLSPTYSNIMLTAGARVKLGFLSINANYQLIDYAIYTIGIGIGI